jgi:hypothetical protein
VGGIGGIGGVGGIGGIGGVGGIGGTGATVLQPLIDAFCTTARKCCVASSSTPVDLGDCESKFPSRFQYYPLVEKGTVGIDQTAFAACVAAYKAAATSCTLTGLREACLGAFVGTRTEGQSCGGAGKFGSYECKPVAGSASCYWQDSTSYPTGSGVCVAIPRGKSGDPCSRSCYKGEACIVDMIGGAAPFSMPCFEEDGLYCSVVKSSPVCKPILHLGDACDWDPGNCGSDNYCGWENNTCQTPVELGELCGNRQCRYDFTCPNGRCTEVPFSTSSACQGTPPAP